MAGLQAFKKLPLPGLLRQVPSVIRSSTAVWVLYWRRGGSAFDFCTRGSLSDNADGRGLLAVSAGLATVLCDPGVTGLEALLDGEWTNSSMGFSGASTKLVEDTLLSHRTCFRHLAPKSPALDERKHERKFARRDTRVSPPSAAQLASPIAVAQLGGVMSRGNCPTSALQATKAALQSQETSVLVPKLSNDSELSAVAVSLHASTHDLPMAPASGPAPVQGVTLEDLQKWFSAVQPRDTGLAVPFGADLPGGGLPIARPRGSLLALA